jgi:hydrogenase expression/formation protein HypE
LRIVKPPAGKLPVEVLAPMLKSNPSRGLVVAPDIGIDVGVTRTRGRFLISSSDPITGAAERIGWHAVNVSANDVATSGIMPDTINVVALFPEGTTTSEIAGVLAEIDETAQALGISVAGGHTEIAPNLRKQMIIVTAFGSGDAFVTAADAKAGDSILITKSAGIEGTSILARLPVAEKLVDPVTLKKGRDLINDLSILTEAKTAFNTGKVHAMHDLTEGGIIGCTLEMSLASKVGFELYADQVPVNEATRNICSKLNVNPLKLIGSGSLLIACADSETNSVITEVASKGIPCVEIGRFSDVSQGRQILSNGKKEELKEMSVQDELWTALSKYGHLP